MINDKLRLLNILLALCFLTPSSYAQQSMSDYIGKWQGEITNKNDFDLDVSIKKGEGGKSMFIVSNSKMMIKKEFYLEKTINLTLDDNVVFHGVNDKQNSEIDGLIQSHGYFYPTKLKRKGKDYKGKWKLSAFQHLHAESLILDIKKGNSPEDEYPAYPILGSSWCNNFKKHKDTVSFTDYFTELNFKGVLKPSEIILNVSLGENVVTQISYKRANENNNQSNTKYLKLDDGWTLLDKPLTLSKMEEDILNNTLDGTESVLVAKNGKIVYENYFDGFSPTTPHEMRSASKSISSAIIGIAIDNGIIKSVDEPIYKFIPVKYQYTTDSSKLKIKLKDLLTMSSGIGIDEEVYQESNNWLKTVLVPSLKHEPGKVTYYKSTDPYLTGIYLNELLNLPLESFIVNKLFSPLGITNYILNTDDTGIPYLGGGLYLTSRDMLKFGQLYLNKGIWNGKRIISEKWVNESFKKHTRLDEASGKNEYGYFWWHNTYEVDGTKINSIEARGAGGQYIFVIPEMDAVVVITSGNYRNRKTRQPEKIIKEYILKSIL
jgi:CubicO group peptidase (beta-lactamase class C family)